MNCNTEINNRRSLRLQNYDYSQAGFYFITICCHGKVCRFGCIENDEMVLNDYGIIARREWTALATRFPNIKMDLFQIMPNHMHGIVGLNSAGPTLKQPYPKRSVGIPVAGDQTESRGAGQGQALPLQGARDAIPVSTIGNIVGTYKSLVANKCLLVSKSKNSWLGRFWQRNFYEHVIRDEEAYLKIADYIKTNPQRWAEDEYHV